MDYRDEIIRAIARRECERVARKVIRRLQSVTDAMLSGGGSGLKNTWDEVCVQVQGIESVDWDAYLETMQGMIGFEVEELYAPMQQAIWLQTQEGMKWEYKRQDEDMEPPVFEGDIVLHILWEFVLKAAGDWNNERIRDYPG